MKASEGEYLQHYKRLGADFYRRPKVNTPDGPGELLILDLYQDSGFGAGVMMDEGDHMRWFNAGDVEVLPEEPEAPDATPAPVVNFPMRIDHSPIG